MGWEAVLLTMINKVYFQGVHESCGRYRYSESKPKQHLVSVLGSNLVAICRQS